MTQAMLAKLVGVTQTSVCRYLRGTMRPKPLVAKKLEEITGVKLEVWLFAQPEELKASLWSKGIQVN